MIHDMVPANDPKRTTVSRLAYESKSSQSKTDGVSLERRDYRSPVHHNKGREILNAVGCKLSDRSIPKKGRATQADASHHPAPAEFSRLVVG
jgi:hypothetical protein